MKNSKWMFKDLSTIDITKLSDEELLSLNWYVNKKLFKHAAHLIRLLKMGIEVLTDGEVNVFREDSQLFVAIKKGEWSLQKVKSEADRLFKLLDEAYVRSKLPSKPDFKKAKSLCIDIMRDYYKKDVENKKG